MLRNVQAQPNFFVDPIAENGLHTVIVRAVAYDPNGYLYVGTNDGLYKFDGHQFYRYPSTQAGPASCPISSIRSLLVYDSALWVAGVEGLVRMNIRTELFENIKLNSPAAANNRPEVKRLAELDNGLLFIGAYGGFYLLHPEEHEPAYFALAELLAPQQGEQKPNPDLSFASAAALDEQGNLWVGTYAGTWSVLRKNTTKALRLNDHWNTKAPLPKAAVYDLVRARSGNLLAATSKGLFLLNARSGLFEEMPLRDAAGEPLHPAIRRILPVPGSARFLLATSGAGLLDWDEEKQRTRQHLPDSRWYNSLPGNNLNDMLLMPNGLLWLGTEDFGLARVRTGLSYIGAEVLPNLVPDQASIGVNDVEALNGTRWLATSSGLMSHRSGQKFIQYREPGDEPTPYLQNLHALNQDVLVYHRWGNQMGVGTYHLEQKQFGYLNFPGSRQLAANPVFDWLSHVDEQGRYYLSDPDGSYYRCDYKNEPCSPLQRFPYPFPWLFPLMKTNCC
ncbi:MAG: hypothetical protein GC205_11910 [Bacteroidetes bacterium]|nr:hypothetical protein [Bacteroidota bacterium]